MRRSNILREDIRAVIEQSAIEEMG